MIRLLTLFIDKISTTAWLGNILHRTLDLLTLRPEQPPRNTWALPHIDDKDVLRFIEEEKTVEAAKQAEAMAAAAEAQAQAQAQAQTQAQAQAQAQGSPTNRKRPNQGPPPSPGRSPKRRADQSNYYPAASAATGQDMTTPGRNVLDDIPSFPVHDGMYDPGDLAGKWYPPEALDD